MCLFLRNIQKNVENVHRVTWLMAAVDANCLATTGLLGSTTPTSNLERAFDRQVLQFPIAKRKQHLGNYPECSDNRDTYSERCWSTSKRHWRLLRLSAHVKHEWGFAHRTNWVQIVPHIRLMGLRRKAHKHTHAPTLNKLQPSSALQAVGANRHTRSSRAVCSCVHQDLHYICPACACVHNMNILCVWANQPSPGKRPYGRTKLLLSVAMQTVRCDDDVDDGRPLSRVERCCCRCVAPITEYESPKCVTSITL